MEDEKREKGGGRKVVKFLLDDHPENVERKWLWSNVAVKY